MAQAGSWGTGASSTDTWGTGASSTDTWGASSTDAWGTTSTATWGAGAIPTDTWGAGGLPQLEPFNIERLCQEGIACQKRTRTNATNQYVFMWRYINGNIGDCIVKGPFPPDMLASIQYKSQMFREWGTPHVVLYQQVVYSVDGQAFLVYENLAKGLPIRSDPYTEKTGISYRVLQREGFIKVSEFMLAPGNPGFNPAWFPTLLYAVVDCCLLQVGDMHFSNIMVRPGDGTVHVIDFDMNREEIKEEETFYFAMPINKNYLQQWLDNIRPHYAGAIARLYQLPLNTSFQQRARHIIALLERYGGTDYAVNSPNSGLSSNTVYSNMPVTNMVNSTRPLGRMVYSGGPFMGNLSYSGYTPDVLKSALQKYIRRATPENNMVNKAVMAAIELYRFAEVGGKCFQTNLYNRLAVIAAEDIAIADLPVVMSVLAMRATDTREPAQLITAIRLLAAAQKTRVASHLFCVYTNKSARQLAYNAGIVIEDMPSAADQAKCQVDQPLFHPNDPVELQIAGSMLRLRLQERDRGAITWLGRYMLLLKQKLVPRPGKSKAPKPETILWNIFSNFLSPVNLEALQGACKLASEKRPFYMLVVCIVLFQVPQTNSITPIASTTDDLSDLAMGRYTFNIDEKWIYDKHTGVGANMGFGRDEFVNEGALIANPHPTYQWPLGEEIYRNC